MSLIAGIIGQPLSDVYMDIKQVVEGLMERNPNNAQEEILVYGVLNLPDACTGVYEGRFKVARDVAKRNRE